MCVPGSDAGLLLHQPLMDVGIWMPAEVLQDKLQVRRGNPEQVWNLSRWPTRLSEEASHRLFVASEGAWRGYFILSREAFYNPRDRSAPFGLLFDARSWTAIEPVSVKCFRGFTYKVPSPSAGSVPPSGSHPP